MVDSDPQRLAVVRGAMRRRADLVLTAASAAEARRCLEQCALPIDWILIDLTSVGDGALAFAAEVRSSNTQIGILLTVDSPFESEFKLLQKPFVDRDLWSALT
jgi:CheY-like chemotaxis protein